MVLFKYSVTEKLCYFNIHWVINVIWISSEWEIWYMNIQNISNIWIYEYPYEYPDMWISNIWIHEYPESEALLLFGLWHKHIFVGIRRFLLNLDKINILRLLYSNLCTKIHYFKSLYERLWKLYKNIISEILN